MTWTKDQVDKLLASGKVRGVVGMATKPKVAVKQVTKTSSTAKTMIEFILIDFGKKHGFELKKEQMLIKGRKWRADWIIPKLMVAIEYEGVFSATSRHTTLGGYTGDVEKYNAFQLEGWKVLRYTAANYKQLADDLNKLL